MGALHTLLLKCVCGKAAIYRIKMCRKRGINNSRAFAYQRRHTRCCSGIDENQSWDDFPTRWQVHCVNFCLQIKNRSGKAPAARKANNAIRALTQAQISGTLRVGRTAATTGNLHNAHDPSSVMTDRINVKAVMDTGADLLSKNQLATSLPRDF